MQWSDIGSNLRFEREARVAHREGIGVVLDMGIFTLLWWLVPAGVLYCLLLPLVAALVWAASYGCSHHAAPAARADLDRRSAMDTIGDRGLVRETHAKRVVPVRSLEARQLLDLGSRQGWSFVKFWGTLRFLRGPYVSGTG